MAGKKKKYFVRVTVLVLIAAVLIGVFGVYEVKQYDESILEIYAQQQDSYVKLILDQIHLKYNRTDEQIVTDILNSLSASNEKYWTLTKDQNIVYVKNVEETNRYKTFSSDTYYLTEGGKAFVDSLTSERIKHEIIQMNQERYVASGTKFSYLGEEYTICLLTYEKVVLDNNRLLQTRIMICIIIFALLLILLVSIMVCTQLLDKKQEKINQLEKRVVTQNKAVESLEDKLTIESSYNASNSLFHEEVLPGFLEKLEERKVTPVTMAMFELKEEIKYEEFFRNVDREADCKYLKFTVGGERILLLFPKKERQAVDGKMSRVVQSGGAYLGSYEIRDDYDSYVKQYEKFKERL